MISGSGDVAAQGQANKLSVRIAGSGDVKAPELKADNVTIRIAGSGGAVVHADQDPPRCRSPALAMCASAATRKSSRALLAAEASADADHRGGANAAPRQGRRQCRHEFCNRAVAASRVPPWRARHGAGISLGIGAWGLVTGVAMVKSGMGIGIAVLMSLTVFAGSAQLATAPLIGAGAPIWVIWATALCVNLRFVVFSAQWRPLHRPLATGQRAWMSYFCADLNIVLFLRRFPKPEPRPSSRRTSGAACWSMRARGM